jgi:hypothetical protein
MPSIAPSATARSIGLPLSRPATCRMPAAVANSENTPIMPRMASKAST